MNWKFGEWDDTYYRFWTVLDCEVKQHYAVHKHSLDIDIDKNS